MKKILFLAVLALGINASAQITVENTPESELVYRQPMGFHALYKSIASDSSYSYSIVFKDCQYQQISVYETVSFTSKQDMIDFFNLVKDVIETKEDKTVTFAGQTVQIIYFSRNVKMYLGDAFCWWSTKWADKCLESLQ
jgi:hypothetical protein